MTSNDRPAQGTIHIGDEAKPAFAVPPDPARLFETRARRLAALAATPHPAATYLAFLARLVGAQAETLAALPSAMLPADWRQAARHGMPPLGVAAIAGSEAAVATAWAFLDRLAKVPAPAEVAEAAQTLRALPAPARAACLADAAHGAAHDLAQGILLLAGLQVHFASLAAALDAAVLQPIADGVCPACGSPPVASAVVGWPGAHNTRYCTCSLCATQWHVVRVKCVLCSSTEGISYRAVDGGDENVKAECCDKCHRYVKILYQVADPALEAVADDVASLGLDLLLKLEGLARGAENPFLIGT